MTTSIQEQSSIEELQKISWQLSRTILEITTQAESGHPSSSLPAIDEEAIVVAANETGAIVTAEEHLLNGGLGAAVACVVTRRSPVCMNFVGLRDTFAESGTGQEMLEK